MAQANVTVLENSTYDGGVTKHIGQLYFDDALVKEVETTAPYTTNTVAYTSPTQDVRTIPLACLASQVHILIDLGCQGWMLEQATTDYDPFVEYLQLTDDISDGVIAWITVGINGTADHAANFDPAAHYYEGGGEVVSGGYGQGTGPSNPCVVGGPPGSTPTCTITPGGETLPAKLKY